MAKWLVKYDSHQQKKGDIYEGDVLPLWLVGKVVLIEESTTPGEDADKSEETAPLNPEGETQTEEETQKEGEAQDQEEGVDPNPFRRN